MSELTMWLTATAPGITALLYVWLVPHGSETEEDHDVPR